MTPLTQAVLLGGAFIGVLSSLPLISAANFCCCLWVVSGGALSAYLLQQNEPLPVTPGRGALVGLLAGVAGAFVWLMVTAALDVVLSPIQQRVLEQVLSNSGDMPPEAREWLEMMAGSGSAPLRLAFGLMLHLGFSVFAALGGLLGAVFFRRDLPPTRPGGVATPPPLPPQ